MRQRARGRHGTDRERTAPPAQRHMGTKNARYESDTQARATRSRQEPSRAQQALCAGGQGHNPADPTMTSTSTDTAGSPGLVGLEDADVPRLHLLAGEASARPPHHPFNHPGERGRRERDYRAGGGCQARTPALRSDVEGAPGPDAVPRAGGLALKHGPTRSAAAPSTSGRTCGTDGDRHSKPSRRPMWTQRSQMRGPHG